MVFFNFYGVGNSVVFGLVVFCDSTVPRARAIFMLYYRMERSFA